LESKERSLSVLLLALLGLLQGLEWSLLRSPLPLEPGLLRQVREVQPPVLQALLACLQIERF
jgi:hypothetical protein